MTKKQTKATLDDIYNKLEKIETRLDAQEERAKKKKDKDDIIGLIGITVAVGFAGYLLFTGGIAAVWDWLKSFVF